MFARGNAPRLPAPGRRQARHATLAFCRERSDRAILTLLIITNAGMMHKEKRTPENIFSAAVVQAVAVPGGSRRSLTISLKKHHAKRKDAHYCLVVL